MTPRLSEPRITPLADEELSSEQRELLYKGSPARVLNIFRTLVRHADLYRRWIPFGNHVLFKSTLPARERELVILRIGHLCNSAYEVHQHTSIGKRAGLTDAEIDAIAIGSQASVWNAIDRALLDATDDLKRDAFISTSNWEILRARYTTEQLMDFVFTVGQYAMVSMALNTFGVQIEKS